MLQMRTTGSEKRKQVMAQIASSARREIEKNGILGLRVADVAAGANSSITQIYRYFGDRDGLLAHVLGDMYEDGLQTALDAYMTKIKSLPVITIDDLVDNLPTPSQYASMKGQEIRLQILATSAVNGPLRERVERASQAQLPLWEANLDHIEANLAPGVRIDRRVFTIMLLVQTMYYRTVLGDNGFTDEEYRQFLRDKLVP